jgi:glycosyltransferase involved in cell wall biosynthesis
MQRNAACGFFTKPSILLPIHFSQQLISVIIPSFNQGRYIERTLASVLSQEGVSVELMVVDGGSSDDTIEILERYRRRFQWISEKDHGQADAVNKGIARTGGDIIGWLNSDDMYCPGAFARIADFFEKNPDVDVVYGDAYLIDAEDNVIGVYPTEKWNIQRLCDICYLCQPAVFFRRRVVERYGLLDEKLIYCMDYEFWLRLALGGVHFVRLHCVLAGSRVHPETKTVAMRMPAHREILAMLAQKLGRVPDRWVAGYARVMAEEKGFHPERRPLGHVVAVLPVTLWTALRFNKRLSGGIIRQSVAWVMNGMRLKCRDIMKIR